MDHDAVAPTDAPPASRRVLVPRTPVPSRVANVLLWAGLAWGVVFTLVMEAALTAAGLPRADRPTALVGVLLIVGWAPLLVGVFAAWLGRIPGLTWLVASTQPRLELDAAGLTIADEHDVVVRVPWSQVAEVRIQHSLTRSPVIGPDGSVVARIPGPLVTPRVDAGGETRLADEIARFRPDLGQALQTEHHARLLVAMLVVGGATVALIIVVLSR